MATKKKQPEPVWEPIEVPVRVSESFRPIYVGTTQPAAPVAATTKPATGTKEA